jgi:hypothetical protein
MERSCVQSTAGAFFGLDISIYPILDNPISCDLLSRRQHQDGTAAEAFVRNRLDIEQMLFPGGKGQRLMGMQRRLTYRVSVSCGATIGSKGLLRTLLAETLVVSMTRPPAFQTKSTLMCPSLSMTDPRGNARSLVAPAPLCPNANTGFRGRSDLARGALLDLIDLAVQRLAFLEQLRLLGLQPGRVSALLSRLWLSHDTLPYSNLKDGTLICDNGHTALTAPLWPSSPSLPVLAPHRTSQTRWRGIAPSAGCRPRRTLRGSQRSCTEPAITGSAYPG